MGADGQALIAEKTKALDGSLPPEASGALTQVSKT
jgi:hypothetical protein